MSQVGAPVGVMYGHSGTEHGIGAGGAMVKMRIKSVFKIVLGIVTVTNLLSSQLKRASTRLVPVLSERG